MMKNDPLQRLGVIEPDELTGSRLQAHYAVQWLSRAARSFVEPSDDDSHTSLFWIPQIKSFASQKLPTGWTFGLELQELALFVSDPDGGRNTLLLDGMTEDDTSYWVYKRIEEMGFDPYSLERALPYDLPAHPLACEGAYETIDAGLTLCVLARWFCAAHGILSQISDIYASLSPGVSPIRCWPHHFDLAILIRLDNRHSENARSIGVGLSPGDEHYDEPYFYVSPRPQLDIGRLRKLPDIGHWHTEGFVAAIVPASRIIDAEIQGAELLAFLRNAIEFGRMSLAA
ncbi:hypothetical protein MnTg02_03126 [bacterium MnTg02]|nr:hypothetical protein MnTg02_03126 [bacterium MnTg02]